MHDVLFRNQQALTESQLAEHVGAIGVKGTPGFVVGRTQAGDTVEGTPIRGAQPLEAFRRIIDQMLAEPSGGPPAANR